MKRILLTSSIIFMMIILAGKIAANTTETEHDYYVDVFVTASGQETTVNDMPKGHRLPSRKLGCYINRQGLVEISTVDVEEVIFFEIYDINGNCLGSFGDSESFTELLFSLDEPLEIRFITTAVMLRGYISR